MMSGDEWASRGLDFAIETEEAELSLEGHAGAWIARALECFDRAGRADLLPHGEAARSVHRAAQGD